MKAQLPLLILAAVLLAACQVPVEPLPPALPGTPPYPAPSATLPVDLSETELRYALWDRYGPLWYCDPEEWPVTRPDKEMRAAEWFAQAPDEELRVITRHLGLPDPDQLTLEETVAVYDEHNRLRIVQLDPLGSLYLFTVVSAAGPPPAAQATFYRGTIDRSAAVFEYSQEVAQVMCPICLAAGTRIGTPRGLVAVQDLAPGQIVWTLDARGQRVAAPIVRVARVAVPAGHELVQLRLDDGRTLLVSPGHPDAAGRSLGALVPGDLLDGARVVAAERVPYGGVTYDLLPAGTTGVYWANGILAGSTLR